MTDRVVALFSAPIAAVLPKFHKGAIQDHVFTVLSRTLADFEDLDLITAATDLIKTEKRFPRPDLCKLVCSKMRAQRLLTANKTAQVAFRNGWFIGLYEFVLDVGRMPDKGECATLSADATQDFQNLTMSVAKSDKFSQAARGIMSRYDDIARSLGVA
jgi:hypothetical protein